MLASFLATLGGIVYLIVISGASPSVTTPNFTLALLVMVVIGGAGSRLGRADRRPPLHLPRPPARRPLRLAARSPTLPKVLRTPLEQPLFILGLLFILVVYFAPGGLARHQPHPPPPAALEEAL